MSLSVFHLFQKGIGPSSSHTVGPMRAMTMFLEKLDRESLLDQVARVRVDLYGSLASTGKGHGTDKAVILGLEGSEPETIDVDSIDSRVEVCCERQQLQFAGTRTITFKPDRDIVFHFEKTLDRHANALCVHAMNAAGIELLQANYYSIGGGFVASDEVDNDHGVSAPIPLEFSSGGQLLALCRDKSFSISDVMFVNEKTWNSNEEIRSRLLSIWQTMDACMEKGMRSEGFLPGRLQVKKRAGPLYNALLEEEKNGSDKQWLDWVNLYALSVSEENAAGGRVVTAPTNGAAGIIPAVIKYYTKFYTASDDNIVRFLLTAAAIGMLFKKNASISGAEVGCQGEVGSACSMAAAGLCEVLGGTPEQVENAAEIAIEHNLGLTCDPIGGLVQIPCIERNAMGAVKAINAARMALQGDGIHYVSLDKAIKTMRDTGRDMSTKYKETARGGLAVNVIEC